MNPETSKKLIDSYLLLANEEFLSKKITALNIINKYYSFKYNFTDFNYAIIIIFLVILGIIYLVTNINKIQKNLFISYFLIFPILILIYSYSGLL